jgi:hypothetical protein
MTQLKAAGCRTIYIDGSFVTSKQKPGDFDACWEDNGVDIKYLESIAPTLLLPFLDMGIICSISKRAITKR